MYKEFLHKQYTLKNNPEIIQKLNEANKKLVPHLVKEGRAPLEFITIKDEQVGRKNKSVFRE